MISKEQKTRLTVFTTASLALFILFLALLILPMLKARGVRYVINFTGTSVNGLVTGSAVKYQGVEVGKVADVSVHPDDLASIRVRLELSRAFPVKTDMTATLAFGGITGAKFIELGGGSNDSEGLPPGGEIPAVRSLGERAEDIVANIDTAVRRINNLLGPDNQKRISAFLENTEKSAAIISGVLEAKRENLANAITNIEKAATDFGAVTENLRRITGDLSGLTAKLDTSAGDALVNLNKRFSDQEMGQVLRNLESFIEVASSSLKKIETLVVVQQADLRATVEGLSMAIDNLSKLSRDLMEDPTMFLRNRKGEEVMKKAALLILLAFGLTGCFSASPDKTYLQLHLDGTAAPGPVFDKALLIDRVAVDDLYDDFRIIYRLTPFEINYYAYSFWAEKPPRMIRDGLDHYLAGRKAFRRILTDASRNEADWILRLTLHGLEEIDTEAAWAARLAMELEMVEAKTGTVLAARRFDRREPVDRKDVAAVPPVLSRILVEELEALLADLKGK